MPTANFELGLRGANRMLIKRLMVFTFSVWILNILDFPGTAADVLTYHNDNARTGWNPNEVVLTPSNVNARSFGLKFILSVDGKVDAQPLYVSGAAVFSGTTSLGNHDLIIVATEHDSVYAFDADTGTLYWHASLVGPGETPSDDRGCSQVTPEIGVTATPAIDRGVGTYGTIYLVAMSKSATAYHQRLHALNLATGQEVAGSPMEIRASYPGRGPHNDGSGHVIFDPGAYKERPGLLLLNGIVYTAWSSHCDRPPYTAWIIGYDEKTLGQTTVLNVDPNGPPNGTFLSDGSGNAFWNSGAGPAADAGGNIYALTANGPFDTNLASGFPSLGDYGDTFLKISTQGGLTVRDYFTPFDQAADAAGDLDLGSGGTVVLPDMVDAGGATRHLAVGAGKDKNIYLVDRDNLGKFIPGATSNTYIYQELVGALSGGEWATAAYFNGAIYYGPIGGALRRFTFNQARLDQLPAAMTSTVFGYPGTTPSISSSGNTAGIVWAYENPSSGGNQAVLHAYDATSLTELYNSNQNPQRDQFGPANKFITPTICNGKVLVGTTNSVGVFGQLKPVVAKDFNGDGCADLLWQNTANGELIVWLMKNGANIGFIEIPGAPPPWRCTGAGDFNGNGQADVVWENTVSGDREIWILDHGLFRYGIYLGRVPVEWRIAAVGDFNGDGEADLVWEDTVTGDHIIWIMKDGAFSSFIDLGVVPLSWRLAGAADFDGDGQADLIWENTISGARIIWILKNGVFASSITLPTVSTQWRIAGAADLLGNGQADIVWQSSTGACVIWTMNNGVPTGSIDLGVVSTIWQLVEH
jgi:hypothetical protein